MFVTTMAAAVKCPRFNIFESQILSRVDHSSALTFYRSLGDMINTMHFSPNSRNIFMRTQLMQHDR